MAVLRVPECGVCNSCTEKTSRRKLCKDRLDVREKLMGTVFKKVASADPEKSKKSKKRKAEQSSNPKKGSKTSSGTAAPSAAKKAPKPLMKKANGLVKARITSNGNKRMAIPDDLLPEFCRRIGAHGTGERLNLINQFVDDYPTVSIRQVTIKMSEVTTKDRPHWIPEPEKKQGRAFMFYLRPRFYPLLPEEERPEGWEAAAAEDEQKWQEEKKKAASEKKLKEEKSNDMESAEESDEAALDPEPPKKKVKVS